LFDKEDFKEEINAHIVEGLHVPYDELKKLQDGDEETTPLVEIDLISMLRDEPKITLVEGAPRERYTIKSQDMILLTVKFHQPSHEFNFGVGMNFISYPLVLTPVV
jgi:hypothetical protein